MSIVTETKRLLPGTGGEASANAYLGAVAVGGILGWGATWAVGNFLVTRETVKLWSWAVTGIWAVIFLLGVAMLYLTVEDGVFSSVPMIAWIGLNAVAFVPSAVGTAIGNGELMWAPWYAVLVLGFLITGVLVTRGWLYLLAAVASVAGTAVAFFVLGPRPPHAIVLGTLHVVPVAIDAAMGGRQMTDEGIPKLKSEQLSEDEEGGVITT